MEYEKISVTLSHFQVKEAIKQLVQQDFPNQDIINVIIRSDGGATAEVKKREPRQYSIRD